MAAANGTRGSFDVRFLYVGPLLFPWWVCTYALTKQVHVVGHQHVARIIGLAEEDRLALPSGDYDPGTVGPSTGAAQGRPR